MSYLDWLFYIDMTVMVAALLGLFVFLAVRMVTGLRDAS